MLHKKGGFTLVELIITISILSILGTLAFLGYLGYSLEARNIKRALDLSKLNNIAIIRTTEGYSPMSLVEYGFSTKLDLEHINVGGKIADSDSYNAGTIKYQVLDIKKEDFLDPNGREYRIGATTSGGGRFEIAASIEVDNANETLIRGTYSARKKITYLPEISGLKQITLRTSDTNVLYNGDSIATTGGTLGTAEIQEVGKDKITLNMGGNTNGITSVELALEETSGLIASKDDNTTPVEHGSRTLLPY